MKPLYFTLLTIAAALLASVGGAISGARPLAPSDDAAPNKQEMSDEIQVKVTILEYLATRALRLDTNKVLFARLKEPGLSALARRLPRYKVKSADHAEDRGHEGVFDKRSKQPGLIMAVYRLRLTGGKASGFGACSGSATVTFEFSLEKTSSTWVVQAVGPKATID